MAVNLSPLGGVAAQFFNNDGVPLSGGLIYTYTAGTNTPANTYTTGAGTIAHSNPIVLDSAGRVPTGEIWLLDGTAYKFVIKDAQNNLIGTYDNIVGINSNFVNYTASQEIQTATAGQTVFTLTTMAYQPGTNSLSVFVDGVNQYGPGAQYAFVETSSTSVTFASGLHVGASVKFTTAVINNIGGVDASQVTYDPPFANSVATNVEAKLSQTVSVTDFGAIGDGSHDDTAAIQAAINAVVAGGAGSGGTVFFPDTSASYRITSTINLQSYVALVGQGKGTTIKKDFQNGFAFIAVSKSYVSVKNLRLISTVLATTTPSGALGFQSCDYCVVDGVSIIDREQFGVWLYDSNYCQVTNCSTNGAFAFGGDNIDIAVLNNSNYNVIANNVCTGGSNNGIAIAVNDPYTSSQPTGNKIVGNQIANYKTYGILVYVTNVYNTKTVVDGNTVETIDGSGLLGTSGTGIYIQSGGGSVVTNNIVSNCCISTTNFFTLAPGAIGVTLPSGAYPVIVANNILQSTRGPCIAAITNEGPVTISGNTCRVNGTDPTTNLVAIYASNSTRCNITNNVIEQTSPQPAIFVLARSGTTIVDTSITNNSVVASTYGIYVNRIDTATLESLRMVGNYVAGPTVQSVQISRVSGCSISENIVYGNAIVFELNNCIRSRMEGNSFISVDVANPVIFFTGTNTGSIFSETNTIVGRVDNGSGSGVIVSQYGNTAPIGGNNWNVGDRVIQSVPVVGQPKGWRCTVAGNPGTWVSEGNL